MHLEKNEKYQLLILRACEKPGLYVGRECYDSVCHLIDGISLAVSLEHELDRDHTFHARFREFLVKKYYPNGNACVWQKLIEMQYPGRSNRALLSALASEFREFSEA